MLFEDEMSKRLLEKEVSPNPFFARKNVFSLDGEWRVTFSKTNQPSQIYSQKIRVPFSVETAASLLSKNLQGKEFFLCYRKEVLSPKEFIGNPALLHFLAVDQVADIYWDGIKIGHHEGGYEPFSVYIPALGRRNILEVIVQDDVTSPRYVHGKQSKNPNMIRYQETSGIYQSVYIERLPNGPYIKELHVLPSYETRSLSLFLEVEGELEQDDVQKVECFFEGRKVGESALGEGYFATLDLHYDFYPWSPSSPSYYTLKITCGTDEVETCFIFRKIAMKEIGGNPILFFNDSPTYFSLLLDQGYHEKEGLTSRKETILQDLIFAKRAGFCGVRLHQKVEQPLYYYYAMLLGLIVMQDIPAGGDKYSPLWVGPLGLFGFDTSDVANARLGRKEASGRAYFEKEMTSILNSIHHYGVILIVSLFNEGWGQFDTLRLTHKAERFLNNCLIESASGWFDKKSGDIKSYHHYFYYPSLKKESHRLLAETEFGGVSYFSWGSPLYRIAFSKSSFIRQFQKVYQKMEHYIERYGLCMSVYTQLADVEREKNGLLDEKREICRLPIETIKDCNESLYHAYERYVRKLGAGND